MDLDRQTRRLIQAYRAANGLMFCGEDDPAAHIMREGFVQALLRVWNMKVESWHGPQAFYTVENCGPESDGRMLLYFEHSDIRILKMVVGVIRGDDGASLYQSQPSMFSSSIDGYFETGKAPPYRELLRLENADMERFMSAICESRPSRGLDDVGPWHWSNRAPF